MPAEKVLLRWINFHLKRTGHKKTVSNFSSDVKVIVLNLSKGARRVKIWL